MSDAAIVLLSSSLGTITTLLVIFINNYFERKKVANQRYDVFKNYANPIILASEQLAWRLKEILESRSLYLSSTVKGRNDFYRYKFESTTYRLNALLGWIQAAQKEQFYFQGIKKEHNKEIQHSIHYFQKVLADGSIVEQSILQDIASLFKIDISSLSKYNTNKLAVKLEDILYRFLPKNIYNTSTELSERQQLMLVREIIDLLCSECHTHHPDDSVIKSNLSVCIKEISRKYYWIYRDLQSTIGEEMLKEVNVGGRMYRVLSYAEYLVKKGTNDWLKKADELFLDINPSVIDKYDYRVRQLHQLLGSLIDIINSFKKIVKKEETISEENVFKLSKYYKALSTSNAINFH